MPSYGKLHPTQERLLRLLADLGDERPSLRELGRRIGISSPNTIAHHIRQLELKGYLLVNEDGFEIVEKPVREVVYLPLYGNAACGTEEFFADENVVDRVPLPARTLRLTADDFLVQARGRSMEPKIHDRDLLLVRRTPDADDGRVVVVALEDGVYAKQLIKDPQGIFLNSFNPAYRPMAVRRSQRLRILGTVRGVLRSRVT